MHADASMWHGSELIAVHGHGHVIQYSSLFGIGMWHGPIHGFLVRRYKKYVINFAMHESCLMSHEGTMPQEKNICIIGERKSHQLYFFVL